MDFIDLYSKKSRRPILLENGKARFLTKREVKRYQTQIAEVLKTGRIPDGFLK